MRQGKHLTSGATVDDYSITIGQESCTSLDLASNQIACFPPESQPEPDTSGLVDGTPSITVSIPLQDNNYAKFIIGY